MKFLAVALVLTFVACGGAQQTVSKKSSLQGEYEGAPEWVSSKTCSEPPVSKPSEKICGVGMHHVRGPQLMNLAQRAALGEATASIALFLGGNLETLQKRYEGEYAQGTGNEVSDSDGKTGNVTVNWAKMPLPGVRPAATWISANDNLYVLGVLEKEKASEAMKGFGELSVTQKKVINNHEKEFLDLLESKGKEAAQ